jgi:hypothetical protein
MASSLSPSTSIMIVEAGSVVKTLLLPYNSNVQQSDRGRLVYIKNTGGNNPATTTTCTISCDTGVYFYPSYTQAILQPYECVCLMESPANIYNVISYHTTGTNPPFQAPDPASVAVPISGNRSYVFVNLLTQSKALLLPSLATLTSNNSSSPYFLIKDIQFNAGVNPLYVSTTGGASIEGIGNSICIQVAGGSIELAGDRNLNRWNILNYYGGAM